MATFVQCCGACVSRLSAPQPHDVALCTWSRERGDEPDGGDAPSACSDVGHVGGDGCSDCLSDFKAEQSFSHPRHRRALDFLHPRDRRVVRPTVWPVTNVDGDKTFRKDLSHLSWDEVYARQVQRSDLMNDWMDALCLKPGDRVLEIGAGPGYVSLALADRVGPEGIVYAVDSSHEALTYLERLQAERKIAHIQRINADAAALEPTSVQAKSALLTMVLHHADDPAKILQSVARCVPLGAPVVIGEFHPQGPCSSGPPSANRLAPEQIQDWCKRAGLAVVSYRRQTPEHYMVLAQRLS
jgi:ubiquinone/menaquinone biosynthesis C-methylase UbiE